MAETNLKRNMPYNREAEEAVINAMLMSSNAVDVAIKYITPNDFYIKSCGILYENILKLYKKSVIVDVVTLQAELKKLDGPSELIDGTYLNQILDARGSSANIEEYAKIVKSKSLLRELIKTNRTIEDMCFAEEYSEKDILEEAEKKIFELSQQNKTTDARNIDAIILDVLNELEEVSKNPGMLTGIPTGFADLDAKLNGLQKSDMIVVAARPSMGKTSFALNIAAHVALKEKKCIALFSLEMSSKQLVRRIFALEGPIDSENMRSGNLSERDWENLIDVSGTVGDSKIIIDESVGISIAELRSKCRRYKAEHPDLSLVIIDYLQLLRGSRASASENRQQEISEISRGLKQIARELDVPVMALSQLSRAAETRTDHKPMMSDLRESGAIEQDADVIMFIYRDVVYNKDTENVNDAEIIIGKQRNGPTGSVHLTWLSQYTKFVNQERTNS